MVLRWFNFITVIISSSEETVVMKEGLFNFCHLYFYQLLESRKCTLKYEDENGDLQEDKFRWYD